MKRLFALTLLVALLLHMPADASRPRAERMAGPLFAEVIDVLDGDTLSVRIQIWIGQEVITDVRVAGIDTPELHGQCAAERTKAQAAKQALRDLLKNNRAVLSDIKLEKYAGRVLATVKSTDGTTIADHLIKSGLARNYAGGKRGGWCNSTVN